MSGGGSGLLFSPTLSLPIKRDWHVQGRSMENATVRTMCSFALVSVTLSALKPREHATDMGKS